MIARTVFSPEHEAFRDQVRRFVEREIAPKHAQWEKDGKVSREAWTKAGSAGLLCASVPEQYGGPGAGFLYSAIVIEELARVGATGPGFALHSEIVTPYLLHHGTEAQKRHWLPRMVTGETIAAVAMTEPGAGSDLQGIKTTAIRQGDDYVINGQKVFITNGQNADLVVVVAKTDPSQGAKGMSLILVERGRAGFTRGRNLDKVGWHAQDTSELFFDNVRVPVSNLLGEEGRGFVYLVQELAQERLVASLRNVATIEAVLNDTIAYTRERQAFGKSIQSFQNTKFKLAEMKTLATVSRVFLDRCLELHVRGELDAVDAAMQKLWSSELLGKVVDECVQLHGGYGYMWEFPVARAFADARMTRIAGGTSEIMKEIIGRAL